MSTDPEQTPDLPAEEPVLDEDLAALLRRNEDGLVPAVVQDADSGRVLMLAWMDDEALRRTLTSRQGTYWSRSREEYWVKGATSGHTQHVRSVELDCDGDALLLTVDQIGPACHTGRPSCFDSHRLLADRT
ncbi:phosphoribosyl-AMP cyclohydrolase [Auraticoccus monumenti]|uniref:phosphoribosyl-AMP cyclohydrolase n=1 Tax=Auraticoccus monumenti TaxID=675864 RepID=UPI0015614078|nr:phosphoribosyl-AMP cyclohydrolase [Auraticoccus monumenti]